MSIANIAHQSFNAEMTEMSLTTVKVGQQGHQKRQDRFYSEAEQTELCHRQHWWN